MELQFVHEMKEAILRGQGVVVTRQARDLTRFRRRPELSHNDVSFYLDNYAETELSKLTREDPQIKVAEAKLSYTPISVGALTECDLVPGLLLLIAPSVCLFASQLVCLKEVLVRPISHFRTCSSYHRLSLIHI